jgi:hypothetical protein
VQGKQVFLLFFHNLLFFGMQKHQGSSPVFVEKQNLQFSEGCDLLPGRWMQC